MKNPRRLTEKNSANTEANRFTHPSKDTNGDPPYSMISRAGPLGRFLSLLTALLIFPALWLVPELGFTASGPPETIPVSIQASAQWEEITRNDDGEKLRKSSGYHLTTISGTMTFDRSASPMVSRQGIMVMPTETYLPDNLTAWSVYQEEVVDLRPQKDRSCDDPLIKRYQGSHSALITDGPPLVISSFSSSAAPFMQNLSENERQFAAQLQAQFQKERFPDFYQFAVASGPSQALQEATVKGIRSTGSPDCEFKDVEKSYRGFGIGIQMRLPESGAMTGYRIWQADCAGCFPPTFGIQVSDMGEHGGEEPLSPAEGGKRNVTYTLSWCFGASPAATDTTGDEEEEEEEDPCEVLQRRVNLITVIMAAYANASIRDYVDGQQEYDGLTRRQMYQKAVENAVMDARNEYSDPADQVSDAAGVEGDEVAPYPESSETPAEVEDVFDDGADPLCQSEDLEKQQAQTNMQASAGNNVDGIKNNWGHPMGSSTIRDYCRGRPVTVEVYDRNGELVFRDLHNPLACWQERFGNEAGESRFNASLEHERTHVKQYVQKGPIQSIDDLANRELEAYQNEMDALLEDMKKLDCN